MESRIASPSLRNGLDNLSSINDENGDHLTEMSMSAVANDDENSESGRSSSSFANDGVCFLITEQVLYKILFSQSTFSFISMFAMVCIVII